MNLRVKRTNRPFFDVSPELATILLEIFPDQIERLKMSYQERLALIESDRAKQNPNANMEVTFAVERHLETEKWNIVLRCGSEVLYFNGPAIHAAPAFGGGQRTPPARVIQEYADIISRPKVDPLWKLEKRQRARSGDLNVADNRRPHTEPASRNTHRA